MIITRHDATLVPIVIKRSEASVILKGRMARPPKGNTSKLVMKGVLHLNVQVDEMPAQSSVASLCFWPKGEEDCGEERGSVGPDYPQRAGWRCQAPIEVQAKRQILRS